MFIKFFSKKFKKLRQKIEGAGVMARRLLCTQQDAAGTIRH